MVNNRRTPAWQRSRHTASLLLLALPMFAQQYNSNNVTPPTSLSGKLNGAASGKQVGVDGNNHAILELGDATTSIDLHPATGSYYSSVALATDDVEQCGYATQFGSHHAMKWNGSASTYTDLHSSTGMTWSYCTGSHGGQQVGFGERPVYTVTFQNAFVWNNGLAVNLHPTLLLMAYSKALGVRSGQQVGYASTVPYPVGETFSYHPASHAIVWAGTAASAIDLNPTGFTASEALATNGAQQAGWAYSNVPALSQHATLWAGTSASFADLHPAGYNDSRVTGLTATQQVGDGWVGPMGAVGSVRHTLVWTGTPESVVDLNQFLPAGYTHAVATGIDALGNVVGYEDDPVHDSDDSAGSVQRDVHGSDDGRQRHQKRVTESDAGYIEYHHEYFDSADSDHRNCAGGLPHGYAFLQGGGDHHEPECHFHFRHGSAAGRDWNHAV